jgi:hypothetical protein
MEAEGEYTCHPGPNIEIKNGRGEVVASITVTAEGFELRGNRIAAITAWDMPGDERCIDIAIADDMLPPPFRVLFGRVTPRETRGPFIIEPENEICEMPQQERQSRHGSDNPNQ